MVTAITAQGGSPLTSTGTDNRESGTASPTPPPPPAPSPEPGVEHPEQGLASPANGSPRLYSDVVATRTSSAASQHDNTQLDAGITEIRSAPNTSYVDELSSQIDKAFNSEDFLVHSSNQFMTENPPDEEDDNRPWTLVESKRARRHRASKISNNSSERPDLTSEQQTAVQAAEQGLTALERERIDRRYENLQVNPESESEPSGIEGPSKGKGVDPKNWGALDLDPSELDLDAQKGALETWNVVRDMARAEEDSMTSPVKDITKMKDIPSRSKVSKRRTLG